MYIYFKIENKHSKDKYQVLDRTGLAKKFVLVFLEHHANKNSANPIIVSSVGNNSPFTGRVKNVIYIIS